MFQLLGTIATIHGLSRPELRYAWIQTGGPKRSLRHCLRDAGHTLHGQSDMRNHEETSSLSSFSGNKKLVAWYLDQHLSTESKFERDLQSGTRYMLIMLILEATKWIAGSQSRSKHQAVGARPNLPPSPRTFALPGKGDRMILRMPIETYAPVEGTASFIIFFLPGIIWLVLWKEVLHIAVQCRSFSSLYMCDTTYYIMLLYTCTAWVTTIECHLHDPAPPDQKHQYF